MTKAIVLISGGLDSRLALKIMQEQGIKILALNFKFPFGSSCCDTNCSFNFCQVQGIKLKVIDCTKGKLFQEYLNLVKKPKHGTGTAINPCIDCRIFILKKAKEIMKKECYDFIVTGEVLGERPMSQYRKALDLVEKESGLKGKILRPLSAKRLEETEPEKKGLVNREELYSIQGRSRKKQIELAKKFDIDYPTPAGGCLLCEKIFAERLKDLFKRQKKVEPRDIELLRTGRHFLFKNYKIIVGRNHVENLMIQKLKRKDKLFELKDKPGPSVLLQGTGGEKKAEELLLRYSKHKDNIVKK